MPGVLMVSHGNLAQEFLKTVEMITGPQEGIEAVGLYPGEGIEVLRRKVSEGILRIDKGDGVLIFVDMFGGTPSNTCISLMVSERDRTLIEVIAGMNLPMVVEACTLKGDKNLREIVGAVRDVMKQSFKVGSEINI